MKTRNNHEWIYIGTNRLPCLQMFQNAIFDPRLNEDYINYFMEKQIGTLQKKGVYAQLNALEH